MPPSPSHIRSTYHLCNFPVMYSSSLLPVVHNSSSSNNNSPCCLKMPYSNSFLLTTHNKSSSSNSNGTLLMACNSSACHLGPPMVMHNSSSFSKHKACHLLSVTQLRALLCFLLQLHFILLH